MHIQKIHTNTLPSPTPQRSHPYLANVSEHPASNKKTSTYRNKEHTTNLKEKKLPLKNKQHGQLTMNDKMGPYVWSRDESLRQIPTTVLSTRSYDGLHDGTARWGPTTGLHVWSRNGNDQSQRAHSSRVNQSQAVSRRPTANQKPRKRARALVLEPTFSPTKNVLHDLLRQPPGMIYVSGAEQKKWLATLMHEVDGDIDICDMQEEYACPSLRSLLKMYPETNQQHVCDMSERRLACGWRYSQLLHKWFSEQNSR